MVRKLTREYFRKMGAIGGKKHSSRKSADTMIAKYGPDYFKRIRLGKKKKQREAS